MWHIHQVTWMNPRMLCWVRWATHKEQVLSASTGMWSLESPDLQGQEVDSGARLGMGDGSWFLRRVSDSQDEVLECCGGCTAMWMHLVPVTCAPNNGKTSCFPQPIFLTCFAKTVGSNWFQAQSWDLEAHKRQGLGIMAEADEGTVHVKRQHSHNLHATQTGLGHHTVIGHELGGSWRPWSSWLVFSWKVRFEMGK